MAPRLRSRKWRWVAICTAVALAALLAWLVYQRTRPSPAPSPSPTHSPSPVAIPQTIRKQITFPIYYPANLSAGLSINPASFRVPEKNVLVFDVRVGNQIAAVSEQAKPDTTTFDIEGFYTTNITNLSEFAVGQGQAAIGQLSDGRQFGSLVVGPTWIIVTAPSSVGLDQVRTLIKDMQPLS
jgi:hypothetical protein